MEKNAHAKLSPSPPMSEKSPTASPTRKAGRIFSLVLTLGLALLAMTLALLRILGMQLFTVLSGSMEPSLPVGALIWVKPEISYTSGQIITFMADEHTVVTHRIVEAVPCSDGVTRFRTQGDANEAPDAALVHPGNILGTPIAVIPYAGYCVAWLKTRTGTLCLTVLAILSLLALFLPEPIHSLVSDSQRDIAGNGR